ncbi:MAG: flagellar basal body rod protein FlgB [Lachnospiraceae bacterium]|jgi:flagellar basal-body rod protein FlgB|nr:flagellar basal body rod protein FlgB [Lachnospiraceae bacterium]
MIGSGVYNYINLLSKAADASWVRNTVLNNNLANVSTPGFKRSDIAFEDYLKKELSSAGTNVFMDQAVAGVDLSKLNVTTYVDQKELSYRLDGNNVDVDVENANLAQNSIRYYTLLDSITQEFSRIRMVLNRN